MKTKKTSVETKEDRRQKQATKTLINCFRKKKGCRIRRNKGPTLVIEAGNFSLLQMFKENKILVSHPDGTSQEVHLKDIMRVEMTDPDNECEEEIRKTIASCFRKKIPCKITIQKDKILDKKLIDSLKLENSSTNNIALEIDAQYIAIFNLITESKVVLKSPAGSKLEVCEIKHIKRADEADPNEEDQ